jgi:hypothetical protein
MLLAASLLLAILMAGFVALAINHRSALEICTDGGGSYNDLTKVCMMPNPPRED